MNENSRKKKKKTSTSASFTTLKPVTEVETVGWHHQLNEHEFEQAPGDGEGQESLVCYSPWGCKESDVTKLLRNNKAT